MSRLFVGIGNTYVFQISKFYDSRKWGKMEWEDLLPNTNYRIKR